MFRVVSTDMLLRFINTLIIINIIVITKAKISRCQRGRKEGTGRAGTKMLNDGKGNDLFPKMTGREVIPNKMGREITTFLIRVEGK